MSHNPSKQRIDKALHDLLEGNYWIDTLQADECYSRVQDDNDGDNSDANKLKVYIAQDADMYVFLPYSMQSLRFRNYFGGGHSLRVRNALLVLAEAIRRDNEERPQGDSLALID